MPSRTAGTTYLHVDQDRGSTLCQICMATWGRSGGGWAGQHHLHENLARMCSWTAGMTGLPGLITHEVSTLFQAHMQA